MKIIHIQPEYQSAIVYYDVEGVLMFTEIFFDALAEFLGTFDCGLEHVEIYAEQYIADEIKKHERYNNVQDIIENAPDIAHLFKPYVVTPGNFKKSKTKQAA